MGASLESETTTATIGKAGVRSFNPMSNLDFLSLPLGRYITSHLQFALDIAEPPSIFAVNYFIEDEDGNFLTEMDAKRVWLKWIELRVHGDAGAVSSPMGYIPEFADLKRLFREVLNRDYPEDEYIAQFKIRVPENLAKFDRIEQIYRTKAKDTPEIVLDVIGAEKKRLEKARTKYGDYISPFDLPGND
jgi:phosphoenolpyruvate carboxykinase (GTP)